MFCTLWKRYRSELVVLTGTGAGRTYKELLKGDFGKDLIGESFSAATVYLQLTFSDTISK